MLEPFLLPRGIWDLPDDQLDTRLPSVRDWLCRKLYYPACTVRPEDVLWLHAGELRGRYSPIQAAAMWWCSALRVSAGLWPVVRVAYLTIGQRAPNCRLEVVTDAGEAPKECLARGYALIDPAGSIILPMPDGSALTLGRDGKVIDIKAAMAALSSPTARSSS